jgi:hypothetical protein
MTLDPLMAIHTAQILALARHDEKNWLLVAEHNDGTDKRLIGLAEGRTHEWIN